MSAPSSVSSLSPQELAAELDAGAPLVVVNILMPERHACKHLPGSVNACVYEVAFYEQMSELAPDKSTAVVCYGHDESSLGAATAAEKLARVGYGNVRVLAGGLKAWEAAGLPIEGDRAGQDDEPDASPILPDGNWALVPGESRLEWRGRNRSGGHTGTVTASHGKLVLEDGALTGAITLDMRSIQNEDLQDETYRGYLVAHLLSDDFFFAEQFPEAVYEITSAAFLEDATASSPNYELHGTFTLRGVTAPLSVTATLSEVPASDSAEAHVALEAHFDLDRTLWGAIYGSAKFFKYLGYHLVYDKVSLAVRCVFR